MVLFPMILASPHALAAAEAAGPPRASRPAWSTAIDILSTFCHRLGAGNPGFPWVLFSLCGSRGSLSLRISLQNPLDLFHNFSGQQPVGRLAWVDRIPPPPEGEDSLDFEYIAVLVLDNAQCLNSDGQPAQLSHEYHVAKICCEVFQSSAHLAREVRLLRIADVGGVTATAMPQVPWERRQDNSTQKSVQFNLFKIAYKDPENLLFNILIIKKSSFIPFFLLISTKKKSTMLSVSMF